MPEKSQMERAQRSGRAQSRNGRRLTLALEGWTRFVYLSPQSSVLSPLRVRLRRPQSSVLFRPRTLEICEAQCCCPQRAPVRGAGAGGVLVLARDGITTRGGGIRLDLAVRSFA